MVVALEHLLHALLPKAVTFNMSLEALNKSRMSPKKDYVQNRLRAGFLQLTDGTHLLLNENALQDGQLNANGLSTGLNLYLHIGSTKQSGDLFCHIFSHFPLRCTLRSAGVQGLQALAKLIGTQTVDFDFEYHQMSFPVDVGVLVLSEGKSMLPTDTQVPYMASPEAIPAVHTTAEQMLELRQYLGAMRFAPYAASDEMRTAVSKDFVAMRQDKPDSTNADTLHTLLTLAR